MSWFDWKLNGAERELLALTQKLIAFRKSHPVLRRRLFFQGRHIRGSEVKDLSWFRPDGKELTDEDWNAGYARSLALRLAGDAIGETDEKGRTIVDETLLMLLNAHHEPLAFTLPAHKRGVCWQLVLDTSVTGASGTRATIFKGGEQYKLEARSIAVLKLSHKDRRSVAVRELLNAT